MTTAMGVYAISSLQHRHYKQIFPQCRTSVTWLPCADTFNSLSLLIFAVTEEEIKNGILESSDPKGQCYWFRQHFPDLLDHTSDKIAKRFMDIAGSGDMDQPAFDFLTKLKYAKLFIWNIWRHC